MRYGELVSRSMEIFWRRKYLWLIGALGGGQAVGTAYSGNVGNLIGNVAPGSTGQVIHWLVDALPVLVALGALLMVVLLAYFLVSCVATGALVRAAAEHDAERTFGPGLAWRAGLGTFGSILGLRLLFLVLELAALVVIGALLLAGVLSSLNDRVAAAVATFLLGGMLILVLIPAGLVAGIVIQLAVRAIVLEQLDVGSAIGRAVRLLSDRLGRVLLVWLLSVALGLGVGLVVGLVTAFASLPLVAVGAIAYAAGGLSSLLTAGTVLLVLFIVAAILVGGAAGSYLSIYWTLAFRRLELDRPAPAGSAAYPPA